MKGGSGRGCPDDKAVKQSVVRKNPKDLGGDWTGIGYRESLLYGKRGQGKALSRDNIPFTTKNASDSSMPSVK